MSQWKTPPSGRLKVNIDGSFHIDSGAGGVGVVVRDENGNCIAALQRSLPFCSSAFHAETEACRAGLGLAIQQGWDNFIFESDCAALTTALTMTSLRLVKLLATARTS